MKIQLGKGMKMKKSFTFFFGMMTCYFIGSPFKFKSHKESGVKGNPMAEFSDSISFDPSTDRLLACEKKWLLLDANGHVIGSYPVKEWCLKNEKGSWSCVLGCPEDYR